MTQVSKTSEWLPCALAVSETDGAIYLAKKLLFSGMCFWHRLKYYLDYSEDFIQFKLKNKTFDMPLSSKAFPPEYLENTTCKEAAWNTGEEKNIIPPLFYIQLQQKNA